VEFVKVQDLGNDFVVIDGPAEPRPDAVIRWCDRRFGIGADGVLVISPVDPGRISMRYWNADGSEAEMCGNGLRCVARLAYDRGWVSSTEFVVETAAGDLPVEILDAGMVRALVGNPTVPGPAAEVAGVAVHPILVGNPHAVVFVDDLLSAPVATLGPRIENDGLFPGRANVEFVSVLGKQSIAMRIWERGVGETMASGTGATAAAFAASMYRRVVTPVDVSLPGGTLTIELVDDQAWMVGPGEIVYSGRID
jgi:diaminopimelate epimerase